jgi:hypothetical protein
MLERLILQQPPNKLLKKQPLRVTISTSFQKPSKQLLKLKTINLSVMEYLCNPLSVLKAVSLQRRDCLADGLNKETILWSARQAVWYLIDPDPILSLAETRSIAISPQRRVTTLFTCLAVSKASWARKTGRSMQWLKLANGLQVELT